MIEAKALFNSKREWFAKEMEKVGLIPDDDVQFQCASDMYNACILAAAIGNAKEEIIQELKEIQKTLKVE